MIYCRCICTVLILASYMDMVRSTSSCCYEDIIKRPWCVHGFDHTQQRHCTRQTVQSCIMCVYLSVAYASQEEIQLGGGTERRQALVCPAGLAVCLVVTPDRALRLPGLFIAPAGSVSWILFTHGLLYVPGRHKQIKRRRSASVAGVPQFLLLLQLSVLIDNAYSLRLFLVVTGQFNQQQLKRNGWSII